MKIAGRRPDEVSEALNLSPSIRPSRHAISGTAFKTVDFQQEAKGSKHKASYTFRTTTNIIRVDLPQQLILLL